MEYCDFESLIGDLKELNTQQNYWMVRTMGGAYYGEFVRGNYVAVGYNNISGVKKIRLKINNEFLDVECYRYKKDYFSDFIQEESILLLQKLIDSKSKDIHDDF